MAMCAMNVQQDQPMQAHLTLAGEHVHLATQDEIAAGIGAAHAEFVRHNVDPLACAAALDKLAKDELLSRDEATLCVIWGAADEAAWRATTMGWLIRDIDIRLALSSHSSKE